MKRSLLLGVAAFALIAGAAGAADLKFKPGEDTKFNWASFEEFKKGHDLKGQTLTIFGPWRGEDEDVLRPLQRPRRQDERERGRSHRGGTVAPVAVEDVVNDHNAFPGQAGRARPLASGPASASITPSSATVRSSRARSRVAMRKLPWPFPARASSASRPA